MQMLSQLSNLHENSMIYKYLSLKDVTVTHGLRFGDKDIKVIISGIAIM